MEAYLGIFIGIGLSATCGFRVFVPLLGMNLASATGHMTLAPDFHWIGSPAALTIFAIATLLALIVPLIATILALCLCFWILRKMLKVFFKNKAQEGIHV